MKRQTVTVGEAAVMLGVAKPTVYAAVKRGELPAVHIGDRVLIPRVALQRMLRLPRARAEEIARSSAGRPRAKRTHR